MATLLERLKDAIRPPKPKTPKASKKDVDIPPQDPRGIFTQVNMAPPKKAKQFIEEGYRSWSYAAINAIAREVASIDLILRQKKGEKFVDLPEHESLSLLHEVNEFMTFYQLVEITQIYQELTGEAFWVLLRPRNSTAGRIEQIWPLRPDWIEVILDNEEVISGYSYKPPGLPSGIFFPKENIIHFKFPDPSNPLRGQGPVKSAALAIDIDQFSAEYNRNFFFNSGLTSFVFTTDEKLPFAELKRLKTEWDNEFKGRKNAHKVGWLSSGFKPIPIGTNQKDGDFLEQRKQVRDEILAVFGVPKSVVGVVEDVNRSNAEASKAVFLENTIKPRMIRFTAFLNEFYLKQFKGTENMMFDFDDPVPTDVAANVKLIDSGKDNWLTINEARDMGGLEPIEDGDVIFKPIMVQPTLGADAEAQTTAPTSQDLERGYIKITTRKFEKKKRYVMPPKHKQLQIIRTEAELKEKGIDKEFKKLMGALMKNKKPKKIKAPNETPGNTPSGWTEEAKDRLWNQKVQRTDKWEEVFKSKLNDLFEDQEKRVITDLESTRYYTAEAKKLAIKKQFNMATENKVFAGVLMPFIRQFMQDEGNFRLFQLGLNQSFDSAAENAVKFIAGEAAAFIPSLNKTTRDKLRKTLAEGLANGESIPQLRNRVGSVYGEATKTRSNMIARTEVSRAVNFGTQEAYIQSGIVEKKEWLTARDERVCPWCNSMDGKTIGVEDNYFNQNDSLTVEGKTITFDLFGINKPPLHPNCRCDLIPVI